MGNNNSSQPPPTPPPPSFGSWATSSPSFGNWTTSSPSATFTVKNKPTYNPTSEQIQSAMNDNFVWYSISTGNPMAKLKIDLPALQQCISNKSTSDCIGQYFTGLDTKTNSLQSLINSSSNATVDSGGNIIWQQNFQNIQSESNNFSPNTILFTILAIFFIVILLSQ